VRIVMKILHFAVEFHVFKGSDRGVDGSDAGE
jgi:hypothetical protein